MAKKIVVGSDQKPNSDQLLAMYEKLDSQTKEIKSQMKRGVLTSRHIQALIEHRNPFPKKAEAFTPVPLKYDKTKDGWTLVEDVPFYLSGQDGQPFTPDIVEFLKPGESYVNGEVMKRRAKELNAHLGQGHAEYLLEHQELIPKEWRDKFLVFPGTVWRDSVGDRYVPYLYCYGDRWYLSFGWLWYDWYSDDRLVCLRK
mgnify:CR=1 FL=1